MISKALILCLGVVAAVAGPTSAAGQARLVSSGQGRVVFEIEVPAVDISLMEDGSTRMSIDGWGSFSPVGATEVPGRTFLVAVPPEAAPYITFEASGIQVLGSFRPYRVPGKDLRPGEDGIPVTEFFTAEDPWEGEIRLEAVEAGTPSYMGRQRVLPVRVSPVYIDGDRFASVRRLRVTVGWDGPSSAVRLNGSESSAPAAGVSPRWKEVYGRLLVNPADVDAMARPLKARRPVRSPVEAGRRLKISIPETGLYSIRADSLIAAGLSPSLSNSGFALRKYYFDAGEAGLMRKVDIPFRVIKGTVSSPDVFSADDRLVFYATGIKDDAEAGDLNATFTDFNVLWLEEDVAGVLMDEGTLPDLSGMEVASFEATHVERKDNWFENNINAGTTDFYFLKEPVSSLASMPFDLNAPASTGTFDLTVRLMGLERLVLHQFLGFSLRNSSGTYSIADDEVQLTQNKTFEFTGLPSSWLVDGENELLISSGESWGFTVNDFTIVYPALTTARDGMLRFNLGVQLPPHELHITGLSSAEAVVVEITDPAAPVFFDVPPSRFQDEGTSWAVDLSFQAAAPREFVLLGDGAGDRVPVSSIEVDTPSALMSSPGPYDAIVISNSMFLPPAMQELADYVSWREQQGFRVLTADVRDVFDEFNGGLPSCEAIKRFVSYGVDNWGVDFVLLVGDGSEDHKRVFYDESGLRGSGPDLVPPFSFSVDVVGSTYDDEVVASDKYYAYLDETYPQEGYPDVFVGRLPVGEGLELRALLNKIRTYEDAGGDLAWRRRIALFADDAWSDYPDYRYKPGEEHFEQGMERIAGFIDSSLPGGFDIQKLFLSHWTDSIHEIGESGVQVYSEATDSTRTYFTPYLLARLNEGALLFSFQGHANRGHLSTESGFSMFSQYRDLNKLTSPRNFIFMGAGCHISQFALASEFGRLPDGPNGDCITEQMLFKPVAGAVSTYASSGFEVLDQNEYLFDRLHTFIFQTPPEDSIPPAPEGTGAHWVFGEMITMAEIEHIGATYYGFDQTFRYIMLGDPMLTIDPGPPNMKVEADWGEGWTSLESDTLRSRSRDNTCRLRFTASDVVSLGGVRLDIDGQDMTGELEITRLSDPALTWPRSWAAEMDYTVSLEDNSLVFSVQSPGGETVGTRQLSIGIGLRLFYGEDVEVLSGGDAPAQGEFRVLVDLPVMTVDPPLLELDGLEFSAVNLAVPEGSDSTFWEGGFTGNFTSGTHTLTARVGEHETDLVFIVGGSGLVVETYSFPNPFSEGTNICFTLNLPADAGSIGIYNVSGRLIRSMDIPRDMLGDAMSLQEPNHVYWDGRDLAGDRVANGTYIVLLEISRGGETQRLQSLSVKLE